MEERAKVGVDFFRIAVLASLSVIVLIVVSVWQIHTVFVKGNTISAKNLEPSRSENIKPYANVDWQAPLETSSLTGQAPLSGLSDESVSAATKSIEDYDGLSNIEGNVARALLDSYEMLNKTGIYTPKDGERIAGDIAASLHANIVYKTYTTADIKTDANVSYDRMLAYRNDLRIALEPLLGNPGYELKLFANYIESRDYTYTKQLIETSKNYQKAVAQTALVTIPKDVVQEHVGILNALSEFGTIVEKMALHADDAFASAALLQTYNTGERNLLTSFNALATYYRSKQI